MHNIMNIIRSPHILVIQLYPLGRVNGVSSHTQRINTNGSVCDETIALLTDLDHWCSTGAHAL